MLRLPALASLLTVLTTCAIPEREVVCRESQALSEMSGEASCDLCISQSCCAQAAACAADAVCAPRLTAMNACARNDLSPGCYAATIEGAYENAAAAQLFECARDHCESCPFGKSLSCVEQHEWPHPSERDLLLEVKVLDRFGDEKGFEGVTVRVCGKDDTQCSSPNHTATTDADGRAKLDVKATDSHATGRLDGWQGYLFMDSAPDDDTFFDAIFYRSSRWWRSSTVPDRVPVAKKDTVIDGLALPLGNERERVQLTLGHALGAIQDCHGLADLTGAEGIVVDIGDEHKSDDFGIKYVNAGDFTKPINDLSTNATGQFVIANIIPDDLVTFTFMHEATGQVVATISAPVVAGRVTILGVWPDERPP